jgi:hypothetical protein
VTSPSAPKAVRQRVATFLGRLGGAPPFCWVPRPTVSPLLIIGGLTVLTFLVFKKQIFDHWSFPWDFLGPPSTTPAYVAVSVGSGHLPSWNPFVASGFPVNVDPQAGLYFPGWWLLGGLGIPATLRVLTNVQVAHVLFGSVGVLFLARVRRLSWPWAAVAAVAYLLFGGFYGEAEHADYFRGFSYLPWLLWTLTPPNGGGRWTRLVALPPLAWLLVSGAYPGQVVSFGITGLAYVSVALRASGREVWHRYRTSLILAVVSGAAVCVAVLLPYVRAEQAHELYRAFEPTAAVRAGESISPLDLLGLYLNNFAWTYDGTVTAWAVAIPVLIGLACLRLEALRRQAPLVACGAVALVLAMTPKIGIVGRAMASVRPLFPSRFPAADYKAVVVVALVVLSAEAWSQIAVRRSNLTWRAVLAGCVLITGALLAPSTYAQPTRELWLLVAVVVACVALVFVRTPRRLLICMLVGLIVIDGTREINDYRQLGRISPWQASPSEAAPYRAHDVYVRKLSALLAQTPAARPARVPSFALLNLAPTGTDPDASGWVADGYHLTDYGSTIERVRWQAEHNPVWSALLLAPWHGYTFPCAKVGCSSGAVHLPTATKWQPSPDVRTLSYGLEDIVYSVNVSQPVLMVENELAIRGWRANTQRVHVVDAGIPLRAWRLSPGHYQFTATYQETGRPLQELAVAAALAAWLGCALTLRRKPTAHRE